MNPKSYRTVIALSVVGFAMLLVVAWNPNSNSFNSNQFGVNNPYVNIKSGALLTNVTLTGTVTDPNSQVGTAGQIATSTGSGWGWSNAPAGGSGTVTNGALVGDVTKPDSSGTTTLATVNASPGTYGDSTHVAQITVNAKGLATTVSSVAITGGSGFPLTSDGNAATFSVTNLNTVSGSNGASIKFGGSPAGIASQLTRSDGTVLASIDTNGITKTNLIIDSSGGAKVQRIFNGTTNGFMPAINAMDYGLATGSDMTAVLQAAINDASEGQRVFIPAGDWTVNGTLIISNRPIILEGEAEVGSTGVHQGTMLDIAAGANNALVIYPTCAGTIVRNIQFYANSPSQNCYAIGITNESTFLSSFTFQGLTIHGFGTGIKLLNCGLGIIDNCYFNNVGTGIWASNAVNAIKVTQSHFQCTNGVSIYGTSTACIGWDISSWFEVCVTSILLNGTVQRVDIHDGYFEGNTNNVVATGVKSLTVRDNYIQGLNNTNLVFVGVTNSIVEGNLFANATPMWHVDATSTVFHQKNNTFNGGSFIQVPSTSITENTNMVVTGGAYYGRSSLTNAAGFALAGLDVTNRASLMVDRSNVLSGVLTFPSSSNAVTVLPGGGDWLLVSATPVSLTNCVGALDGYVYSADITVSNSTAAAFTNFCTIPNAFYVGQISTNALTIPAGKQGYWRIETRGVSRTNVFSCVDQ